MEVHAAADLFPLDDEALHDLAEDLRRNGQLHPIESLNGKSVPQRAMIAARIVAMYKGGTRNPSVRGPSEIVGKAVGVGRNTVYIASKVLAEAAPELIAAVDAGTISVRMAGVLATDTVEEQREAVTITRIGSSAAVRVQFDRVMGSVLGFCQTAGSIQVPPMEPSTAMAFRRDIFESRQSLLAVDKALRAQLATAKKVGEQRNEHNDREYRPGSN